LRKVERRACARFTVPGASLSWTQASRLPFGSASAELGCLLMDLSRGGARFLASRSLKPGARIEVEVEIPDDARPILLTGKVVWSCLHPSHNHEVAVEFDPYGDLARTNTPEKLRRIADLEACFAPDGAGGSVGGLPTPFAPTLLPLPAAGAEGRWVA